MQHIIGHVVNSSSGLLYLIGSLECYLIADHIRLTKVNETSKLTIIYYVLKLDISMNNAFTM